MLTTKTVEELRSELHRLHAENEHLKQIPIPPAAAVPDTHGTTSINIELSHDPEERANQLHELATKAGLERDIAAAKKENIQLRTELHLGESDPLPEVPAKFSAGATLKIRSYSSAPHSQSSQAEEFQ